MEALVRVSILLLTFLSANFAKAQDGFSRSDCGSLITCESDPVDCDPKTASSCTVFASWRLSADGNAAIFSLYAATTTYIAIGFSKSGGMDDSDVYICTADNEMLRARNSNYKNNSPAVLKGVTVTSVTSSNGVIQCQFSRTLTLNDNDNMFFDLSPGNSYTAILSWGGALTNGGIQKHTDKKVGRMIAFTAAGSTAAGSTAAGNTVVGSTAAGSTAAPNDMNTSGPSEQPMVEEGDGFSRAACGSTITCLSSPRSCDPKTLGSCTYFASWRLSSDGSRAVFALYAASQMYVAFGLSKSGGMANSDVYACTSNNEVVRSRNTGYTNSRAPLKGVSNQFFTNADGVIQCEFSRVLSLSDGDATFYDLRPDASYTAILSYGGSLSSDGTLMKHTRTARGPLVTFTQSSPHVTTVQPGGNDGCGITRGCFSSPISCIPTQAGSCQAFVSWVYNSIDGMIDISMMSAASGYVAIGFSKSGGMDDTDVYACTSQLEVTRSRNVGRSNIPQQKVGVSKEVVSFADGILSCTFSRTLTLDAALPSDATFFDLSQGKLYTILLAWANSLNTNGDLVQHDPNTKVASGSHVDLTEISAVQSVGGNTRLLAQLHGTLMTIAWIGFASIGITTARFMKPVWGEELLCGTKVWFAIHRFCMVSAVLVHICGLILIIVYVGGIIDVNSSKDILKLFHAILGTIVVALAFINVIMALFRPHPGEPRRELFNWAHWFVGTSAHLLALTAILIATATRPVVQFANPVLQTHGAVFWIALSFAVIHMITWLVLQIVDLKKGSNIKSQPQHDVVLDANSDTNRLNIDENVAAKEPPIKPALLKFYIIVVMAAVVGIVIGIYI